MQAKVNEDMIQREKSVMVEKIGWGHLSYQLINSSRGLSPESGVVLSPSRIFMR